MRYEEFVKKAVEKISSNDEIQVTDLPEIDLYMDQITTFMDDKLSIFKRNEDDKILTKTMINNYVKSDIIPKPTNKKYSKDQLLLLILVYNMKRVLSVKDLEKLMAPIIENYKSDLEEKIKLEDLYSGLIDFQKNERKKLAETVEDDVDSIKEFLNEVGLHDDEMLEIFTLVVALTMKANVHKLLAENILDEYFSKKKADEKKKKK